MSRNLLISEYIVEIQRVAPLWLGTVSGHEMRWTSTLSSTACGIELKAMDTEDGLFYVPEARIRSSGGLPLRVVDAYMVTLDTADMLRRCLSACAMISDVIVWFQNATCDGCEGRGQNRRGEPCSVCEGKRYRTGTEPRP